MSRKRKDSFDTVGEIVKASNSIGYPITHIDQVDDFATVLLSLGKTEESELLVKWKNRMKYYVRAEHDLDAKE